MNLIVCSELCKYQLDGYCTFNQISSLSNSNHSKCGYFEPEIFSTRESSINAEPNKNRVN